MLDVMVSLPARVPPAKPLATLGRTTLAGGPNHDRIKNEKLSHPSTSRLLSGQGDRRNAIPIVSKIFRPIQVSVELHSSAIQKTLRAVLVQGYIHSLVIPTTLHSSICQVCIQHFCR